MFSHRRASTRTALLAATAAIAVASPGARAAPDPEFEERPIRVLVAVLPFSLHSSRRDLEVETAVAELLIARLEESGRVRVVDAVVMGEALVEHVSGERSEDTLRSLAREVGADWVVEGSLTELGGHYSLDVRVTPAEEPLASHSLVFTAAGEVELLDRVNGLAERLLGIVVGERAQSRIAQVQLLGADRLGEAALRDELRTAVGAVFDDDAVQADLAMLRGRPGIGAATVETDRSDAGVVVRFQVVPVEYLGGTVTAQAGERVADIRIRGNRRIEADAIRARIATQPGDRLSPARVAEDVRAIHELGFFDNIRVFTEVGPAGRVLIFEVEENPVVRQITIAGNEEVEAERIKEQLNLSTGSSLDIPLLIENRERIAALYRAEGFYLAVVRYEIETLPTDAVAIHFDVEEGERLKLREIRFEGNEHFDDDELLAGLQTRPWRFWYHVTRFLRKGDGSYAEPVFHQDLQAIRKKYADAGYLRADVGEPEVHPDEEGLTITVAIDEGARFKVGQLEARGDPSLDIAALGEELALPEDEWFNRSHLTADVDRLTARYTNRGFYRAEVEPLTEVDEANGIVDVVFEVDKGPLYFVRQIDVAGNTRSVDSVIRREMQLVEGELYSARAIALSERRLRRLGYFDEVNFETRPTDHADQIDLEVRVAEKPTGSLSFGAGFSSRDRFVISGNLSQNNLFGRGYRVSLAAEYGRRRTNFNGTVADPRFLDSEYGVAMTLFQRKLDFNNFDEKRLGLDLSANRSLDAASNTRGALRYEFSSREIDLTSNLVASSPVLRQFAQDATSTSRVSLSVSSDTRDDAILATEGHQLAATLSGAGLGGFTKFLRLEAFGAYHMRPPSWLPLPRRDRSSFYFSARAGYTLSFNSVDDFDLRGGDVCSNDELCPLSQIDRDLTLPVSDRYFMGGLGALRLRGYRARSVGPRRAELRRAGDDLYVTRRRNTTDGSCTRTEGCNSLSDKDTDDFDELEDTEVVGGSQFISLSAEYRFPVSEELGLVGILFFDAGNAFAEDELMFDVSKWRFGTGLGALWFSPFGPLQVFWGIPLDPLSVERSSVFEFNVGGAGF